MSVEYSLSRRRQTPEKMSDHQLLALVLELGGHTPLESQELAHSLLDEADGNFAQVFDAPIPKLLAHPGLGEDAAYLIKLYYDLMIWYLREKGAQVRSLNNVGSIANLLFAQFFDQPDEQLYALLADENGTYLGNFLLAQGSGVHVSTPSRRIMEQVLASGAARVVLAHNHPDGTPVFSENDLMSSLRFAYELAAVGLCLADHYLFVDYQIYSLRDQLGLAEGAPWPLELLNHDGQPPAPSLL